MRYLGGCTECHTIWRGCRCPLRCEECGARLSRRREQHLRDARMRDRRASPLDDPGRWDEDRRAEASVSILDPPLVVPEARAERVADETPPARSPLLGAARPSKMDRLESRTLGQPLAPRRGGRACAPLRCGSPGRS